MMTGRRRDTITRLLNVSGLPFTQEGDYDTAPKKYDTIKALPVIYGLEGSDPDDIARRMTAPEASMKLNVRKAEKLELEMEVIRKERIPRETVDIINDAAFQDVAALLKTHLNKTLSEELIGDIFTRMRDIGAKIKEATE